MSTLPTVASTLEEIAAKLKEINNGAQDVSKLLVVTHEASGLSFRVGPMSRVDYDMWQNVKSLEDLQHESSGAAKSGGPKNRDKSDRHLLTHAVMTETGEKLTIEIVEMLFNGPGFGPSTHVLCEAAAAKNPPRAELVREIQLIFAVEQSQLVLWRILFECGLGKALLNALAPSATEEEREWAAHQIDKAQEVVAGFEPYFNIQDAAKAHGITFKDAANLAVGGSV